MIVSELIVVKSAGTVAAAAALLAVIEVATQNAIVAVFQQAVTGAAAILLAWIAYKQLSLSKKQAALHETVVALEKNTNGIRSELVLATAAQKHAEGKAEGKAEQKAADVSDAALIARGKLEGAAAVAPAPTVTTPPRVA